MKRLTYAILALLFCLAACRERALTERPVEITSTSPRTINSGETIPVVVTGRGLDQVKLVIPPQGATIENISASENQLSFRIRVQEGAVGPIVLQLQDAKGNIIPGRAVVLSLPGEDSEIAKRLQVELSGVSNQIKSIQENLQESRERLSKELAGIRDNLSAQNRKLSASVTELQKDVSNLNQNTAQLENRVKSVEEKQDELSRQIQETRAYTDNKFRDVESRVAHAVRLSEQSLSNQNLVVQALEEAGRKKVGGFLGIGRNEILSDETLARLRGRMSSPIQQQIQVQPPK